MAAPLTTEMQETSESDIASLEGKGFNVVH